jgi:hypothetical protein
MFEILPNPSLEVVLIAVRAIMLIGAFWIFALAFVRWRRADERATQELHDQMQRAFAEVRSLHETMAVMSARIEAMSERSEAGARLAPAGPVSAQRGYDLATRLAKNGAGVDELMETCGLTRHEAELLARLHGERTDAASRTRRSPASVPAQSATLGANAAPASWSMPPAAQSSAATQPAPAATGRRRGSLLSVVG